MSASYLHHWVHFDSHTEHCTPDPSEWLLWTDSPPISHFLCFLPALFDEPLLYLQSTCDSFNITATLSNGFPQPEVRWHDSSGREINQTSSVHLDARGLYTVSSAINFSPSGIEEVTMEMKLKALNQNFTRSLLLHPLPDSCKGQLMTDMMSISSDRYVGLLSLVLMLRFMNRYVWKFW